MYWPDYEGKSIVNLMSTIQRHLGGVSDYPGLSFMKEDELENVKNIILIVIDGLGYNFLKAHDDCGLTKYVRDRITTVFPSTTAAAMTTFYTGVAPKNHGLPAYYTFLKSVGLISIMPQFLIRGSKRPIVTDGMNPNGLLQLTSIFDKIKARGFTLIPKTILGKPYNEVIAGRSAKIGFVTFQEMLTRAGNVIKNYPSQKLVTCYWPTLDNLAHKNGINSPVSLEHFSKICQDLSVFLDNFPGKDDETMLIVTGDHGMIDVPGDAKHWLDDYPELEKMMVLPLCGEPRAPFCYVKGGITEDFASLIQEKYKDLCQIYRAQDLIDEGKFGLFDPHPLLSRRVGDFILIMKEKHVLRDLLFGEKKVKLIGFHGGVSEDEMFVPMIIG
ncbi:MAG: alkaline phosphatase family protein [Promethearchaeota archaeon]